MCHNFATVSDQLIQFEVFADSVVTYISNRQSVVDVSDHTTEK